MEAVNTDPACKMKTGLKFAGRTGIARTQPNPKWAQVHRSIKPRLSHTFGVYRLGEYVCMYKCSVEMFWEAVIQLGCVCVVHQDLLPSSLVLPDV